MRKLMSLILVLFISISVFAETYQKIEIKKGDDGTSSSDLTVTADAVVSLDMSKLISYDIGFSSTNVINFSSNPNVSNAFNINVSIRDDQYLIGSLTIYFYWKVISNLGLSFSMEMEGPMKNDTHQIPWTVLVQRTSGSYSTLSSDGVKNIEDFASYSLPSGGLGEATARSVTIYIGNQQTVDTADGKSETFYGVNLTDTDVYLGTYTGNLKVTVEVMA